MAKRDMILIIIVLVGICWLIYSNYHRVTTPSAPHVTTPQTVTPTQAAPAK